MLFNSESTITITIIAIKNMDIFIATGTTMEKLEKKYENLKADDVITFPGQSIAYVVAVPLEGRYNTLTGFEFSFLG